MNNINKLENEYKDFMIKLNKIANDLKKEISKLSPENLERLKFDLKNNLIIGLSEIYAILSI